MPPEESEKSPLARMRERLYAPGADPAFSVPSVRTTETPQAERWTPAPPPPPKKPGLPRVTLFLIGAGVFFTIAVIVAAALIIFGGRTVSTEHITIDVQAEETTGSGDTVELLITVVNDNPVALSGTSLSMTFPEGTRLADDATSSFTHYSDTLGDIPPGGRAERTIRAVIFGAEGERITLPIRFEYRTPGATVPFIKEKTHEFLVTTSPLSVSIGALSQVSSGQSFDMAVAVRSNAQAPIVNAALIADYPPGFTLRSATPLPATGSLFDLGTMAPGEEKVIRITGTITGEDRDTRVFRFTTGTRVNERAATLAVTYTKAEKAVVVEKPFLSPTLTLNQQSGAVTVLEPGIPVTGNLSFVNTLTVPLEDATIVVALSGSALDSATITTPNGFYRSSDGTITFSKETLPALARLAPGQTGSGSFAFMVRGAGAQELRNPIVNVSISVAGRRMSERNVPTTIQSTVTRALKVRTNLALTAAAGRGGAFTHTGPIPPKADTESTYTITWALANTVNSVGGAMVSAVLPSYVRFTGKTFPVDAAVAYNETTRTVTWSAGDVPAGTSKEIQFQVALTPSASQRSTSPVLVQEASYAGTDRFTAERLTGTAAALTTEIPSSGVGSGQVQ